MREENVVRGIPKKKRKFNKKRVVLLLLVVVIIIVAIVLATKHSTPKEEVINGEKYVKILADGTKLNKSNKIAKEREFDGLKISGMQLTEKNNVSVILADVTNTTNEKKGGYKIRIKLIDDKGEELISIIGYLPELEPNESTQLNTQTTLDFANAYDLAIEKAE